VGAEVEVLYESVYYLGRIFSLAIILVFGVM